MSEDLLRFESPVSPSELPEILAGSIDPPVEKTEQRANLEPVEKIFRKLEAQGKRKTGDYDIAMCEALHRQLKHLPAAVKLDMRMWHWLAIKRFPDFVWIRWDGKVPADVASALARGGMAARFLGNRSLRGRNRNALARLFFTAEILYDQKEGYRLATTAFANQDRHTSLFERKMGLLPEAAKALIRVTQKMGSEEIQKTAKRLNHIGSALVLDTVDEQQLIRTLR
jgi:uncharacterized protein DUF6339